ncbi:DgyrCDS4095 [Dimorphilus gyrociliatus]|uniref:DgyrCDS4095 n=1 Tax=Dimorphilus gyrociliatus TaxID=2664684 RepID=A0A7I8VKH7_9ANNE|nr:DgyrCDS4095 [Dimorphilus gyrociliatus]
MDLFGDLPEPEQNKNDERKAKRSHDDKVSEDETKAKKSQMISMTDYKDNEIIGLHSYVAERKGERDEMQDTHVNIDNFTSNVDNLHHTIKRLAYYGVYDGHNGSRAAKYCEENMHVILAKKLAKANYSTIDKDIKKYFIETYKKVDDAFLAKASQTKPSWKDGSTSTSILIVNNIAYVASVGDSKAVLYRFDEKKNSLTGLTLTTDHNPTSYEERMRIQKAGGTVKDGRVLGHLEVSRSIGDGQYKNHGVSCIPDVKRCNITETDRFLVIACDGLWKRFSVQEISELLPSTVDPAEDIDKLLESLSTKLVNMAIKGLVADNVTICIVALLKRPLTPQ